MAVRGQYNDAEKRMIEEFNRRSEELTGWLGKTPDSMFPYPAHKKVTRELIKHMGMAADFRNPLYQSEEYAENTRWGDVIAPPFYYHAIMHGGGICPLLMPPDEGVVINEIVAMKHTSDFYLPIRPGDKFRVWFGPTVLTDVTTDEENALRRFCASRRISYLNQRDEVACTDTDYHYYTILPPGSDTKKSSLRGGPFEERGILEYTDEYKYSREDIKTIDEIYRAEPRRGRDILYWEEVVIGEEIPSAVMGPLTAWDSVCTLQGFGAASVTMNDLRMIKADTVIPDFETNIPHQDIELHLTDKGAKLFNTYSTTPIGPPILHLFGRLLTNWMGDDGWIRRLSWKNLANTPFGDTAFAKGVVKRKYVENGEHLVDLDIWMESIRGYVSNLGPATVSLLSKEGIIEKNEVPKFEAAKLVGPYSYDSGYLETENEGNFKIGDRIKVRERPDWPMPCGFKLANALGTVDELIDDAPGYVFIRLDDKLTGIDVRVPLGFRTSDIEKL